MVRAREDIEWVDERDLSRLEHKNQPAAGALSLFTGGGGHLYVGDYARGFALIAGMVGALALGSVLPGAIAALPFLAVGVPSALSAWRKARAINRYLAARVEEYDRALPHPPAYRLLAAMNQTGGAAPAAGAAEAVAAPAGPAPVHGALIERLRKLQTLLQAGVIDQTEHRARKIDLLAEVAAGIARDDVDDLLFELLPIRDQGVIDDEDIAFIKQLGES